jgi:hypothetical protein
MTLSEFKKGIDELFATRPELRDTQVIYSRDDEGNGFDPIIFTPSVGNYDGDSRGEFVDEKGERGNRTINAVCIN